MYFYILGAGIPDLPGIEQNAEAGNFLRLLQVHGDVPEHDARSLRVVGIVNAHHRLVEIVQHRDVEEGHVLDGGPQLAALVGLVANFHGLGQIRPELAAVEEDVRAVAALAVGIVLHHQAVVPGADEAVADGDIAAGLHGNAVAVGPGGDDLDAADVHIVAAVQLHAPGVGVQDTDAADGHILALPEGAMGFGPS